MLILAFIHEQLSYLTAPEIFAGILTLAIPTIATCILLFTTPKEY